MQRLGRLTFTVFALMLSACAAMPAATPETGTSAGATQPGASNELILATTTSTDDSGLLDFILPDFEQKTNSTVKVVAVGTGEALTLGENGDADVVLVHARAREEEFVAAGFGVERQDVMVNDFVILGPESDPAGIAGSTDAAAALRSIAAAKATFISRGDESGTHTKEMSLWQAAGVAPAGAWYRSVGQGMGAVLTMAEEQEAYTLSDRGTYLARTAEGYALPVLVDGDPRLFNPYGVILVNPERHPHVKAELGQQFIDWFVSPETQRMIGGFGVEQFGEPLFVPDSAPWRALQPEGGE